MALPKFILALVPFVLSLWVLGGRYAHAEKEAILRDSYQAEEVIGKTPSQLVRLRGFKAEIHYARTPDGYFIHVVRIVNPKFTGRTLKRPVVFNHGLLESSTIWLINARDIGPQATDGSCLDPSNTPSFNESLYLNGPFVLANHGYDVWLMSMRGTDWSLKHERLNPKNPQFWNYCLDDFGLVDVPTVIDYVRAQTQSPKVGYIGHSQATFSIFALLSIRPSYATVIEPVVAVAPVAYFDHITSIARLLFIATLKGTSKDWHGPFPNNAKKMRATIAETCDKKIFQASACTLIEMLIGGKGDGFLKGFYYHLPYYTSLKVLRHFGQLIENRRFGMYDYGQAQNLKLYGSEQSPSYPVEHITSRSIVLVHTRTDALSPPQDVARLVKRFTVPLYREIFIEKEFDHFDLITDKVEAARLVFLPILGIFEEFELRDGVCAASTFGADHFEDVSLGDNGLSGHDFGDSSASASASASAGGGGGGASASASAGAESGLDDFGLGSSASSASAASAASAARSWALEEAAMNSDADIVSVFNSTGTRAEPTNYEPSAPKPTPEPQAGAATSTTSSVASSTFVEASALS